MGTGSAVAAAARDVSKQLAELGLDGRTPWTRSAAPIDELLGEGTFELPGGASSTATARAPLRDAHLGRDLLEVGVDPDFGLLRLRRAVGVYSAGRIINAVTARAQMVGGSSGAGARPPWRRAIRSRCTDGGWPRTCPRGGTGQRRYPGRHRRLVRRRIRRGGDLIGARGIGELGATGVDAAVAAAVHDAVGMRVRDLPILPWKVLA